MRIQSLLLASTLFISASAAEPQNGTGETDGYRLVWQDLFDKGTLDPMRWEIEVNGDGGGNNELQYYTDREENVRVGDDGQGNGCLILTARRESYKGKSFTSGRIISKNLTVFTHGKLEAAIRLPKTANGLWPAFWAMGNDIDQVGWPRCGEIDIVEMGHQDAFGKGTQERYFNGACHWGSGWPNPSYARHSTWPYSLQDGEFHIFTLIWDANTIEMYVDRDKYPESGPYYKMDIPDNKPSDESYPGNYFHKDNFILFNLAVGGNFPGIYNASGVTALNDDNGDEASMYVNYVKIYQKGDASESFWSAIPGDKEAGIDDVTDEAAAPAIRVEGRTATCEGAEISAYSADGALVGVGRHSLDLSSLAAGLYLLTAPGIPAVKIVLN